MTKLSRPGLSTGTSVLKDVLRVRITISAQCTGCEPLSPVESAVSWISVDYQSDVHRDCDTITTRHSNIQIE
ncbi:hypothetical protein KOW79_004478 [Hemibagrus wyckioides]|uniref:Uncharacterized protein n=1 Tax=Hemibagrus wyckioides TaxID=337641 RepID=A0A9D3SUR8_9TELE|nr:hypothetical protein KOW79_004478 [Hemibagrus wyckioides]